MQEQAEEPEEEGRVACGDCRCGVGGDPTGGWREACWVKVAAVPVGGGRAWCCWPPDWRVARGLWGLAGLRDDAPSEARGADGERAGRPRAARRSGGWVRLQ